MESPIYTAPKARLPDYQRIARELRAQVINGKFAPRSRLPSTEELAVTWRSSVHTVHNALAVLAKEGWIERVHGSGTFVTEPKSRFTCAGIYHETDIGSYLQPQFAHVLHDSLLEQFALLKKETRVFVDSRPIAARGTLLPALAEAIQNREIQCLIAPTAFEESSALSRLSIPTAFTTVFASPNLADFDREDFLREGIRSLARQGCRSVGMIYPFPRTRKSHPANAPFYTCFPQVIREEGLEMRPEWISQPLPHNNDDDLEVYGYTEFQKLWKLRKKPDGLIVFPDTTVRGVITSVLKFASDAFPSKIKFVFHRNAHMKLLCPFPVTWGISDEDVLAKKLVQIIEKQFRGEKVSPSLIPYELKPDDALRWQ